MGASLQAKKAEPALNIIPEPRSVVFGKGNMKVKGANFNYDPSLDAGTVKTIALLVDDLNLASGKAASLAVATGVNSSTPIEAMKGFYFLNDASLSQEEYKIEIVSNAAKITAAGKNGFLYAISSLRQMLPVESFGQKLAESTKWVIPCCTIQDKPRFGYRGLMLDCARHFYSVEQVKRVLDLAAMYKLNRFHWHLTEDQGWRVEIKKYPLLTEVGAFRSGTQQTYDRRVNDGIRYGGYYTQDRKSVV